jgi:cystathionine beta-lyase/cystathionine gamma-synthase
MINKAGSAGGTGGGPFFDPHTGAVSVPIYQTSTFAWKDVNEAPEYDYARSGNPTRRVLEETIARMEAPASSEGGEQGFAFASGMAATSSVLGIFGSGAHIIAARDIYGGSYRILSGFYKRWGMETSFVDASDIENIKAAIRPDTKALFLETPSNPLLKITCLRAACDLAREAKLITIVDNTFMTPCLQRPLELGADIVVHSATKFLGGHSDVILGLAVTRNEELGRQVYAVQNGFGAVAAPHDSWLVLRGMKTLQVRMDRSQQSAGILARTLAGNKNVAAVYYPGLPGHPAKEIHDSQASGPGAVFSFETRSAGQARRFLNAVRCASAVSLGGVETIASYPVKMSHASVPPQERERLGIRDTLIRISVGLEDIDYLISDFEEALDD